MKKIAEIIYSTQNTKNKFISDCNIKGYKVVETGNTLTAYVDTDEEKLEKRKELFEKEFFNTSLGWVSRKVHMQAGEIWDFLKDIAKPELLGKTIITYTPNEDYTNLEQHRDVLVTEQFLQECANQIHKDFYGEHN